MACSNARLLATRQLRPISAGEARLLIAGKTEKPSGIDPTRLLDLDAPRNQDLLIGAVALSDIAPNEAGERYDATVDARLARIYASRDPDGQPPIILVQPRRGGLLRVLDGGHRLSAARLRGDATIEAIVVQRRPAAAQTVPVSAPVLEPVSDRAPAPDPVDRHRWPRP